jgi:hypothetical protein
MAPKLEYGYVAQLQMTCRVLDFFYSISYYHKGELKFEEFINNVSYSWQKRSLLFAIDLADDYNFRTLGDSERSGKVDFWRIKLSKFFGSPDRMINAWRRNLGDLKYDQNDVRKGLNQAYLAKYSFDWSAIKRNDLKAIEEYAAANLRSRATVFDLRVWFQAARVLRKSTPELIEKMLEWDFLAPSAETAFLLMILYALSSIEGSIIATDRYHDYRRFCKERIHGPYNKIFCPEWIGSVENTLGLFNHAAVGTWDKANQFFEKTPAQLVRLKGKVVKYLDKSQGFIELGNTGIEVFYVPGKVGHLSSDRDRNRPVDFFVGFNYDGARAFEVYNLE